MPLFALGGKIMRKIIIKRKVKAKKKVAKKKALMARIGSAIGSRLYLWLTKASRRFQGLLSLPFMFAAWWIVDAIRLAKYGRKFSEYGITVYTGRQGQGKTISMVQYLIRMRRIYPKCKIVTNFKCSVADHLMTSWRDFFDIRNGEDGVIFALDEIQTEWSSLESKDFPPELLGEICQQRKQRVKIVTTSQVYGRMAKPLREQTFEVAQCTTFANRWTVVRGYDAWDYEQHHAVPQDALGALRPQWWTAYIQSDELRAAYDTDEKVARLKDKKFIPRKERSFTDG